MDDFYGMIWLALLVVLWLAWRMVSTYQDRQRDEVDHARQAAAANGEMEQRIARVEAEVTEINQRLERIETMLHDVE